MAQQEQGVASVPVRVVIASPSSIDPGGISDVVIILSGPATADQTVTLTYGGDDVLDDKPPSATVPMGARGVVTYVSAKGAAGTTGAAVIHAGSNGTTRTHPGLVEMH